ncbi:MAG TPA: ubiquinol-cytochrome C chaperone family protein [Hyphomicrobiaceae bacterium]|nr:ubiquinol-cytochrome C chaperone family protein [Hyphomicrobiaceae bacterium]
MPLWSFFEERSQLKRSATELYGSIVAQARAPALYRALKVPDTPEARLEMLMLHLALVLLRLATDGVGDKSARQRLARALAEVFVCDMDVSMRELGVGDLSVPRHVNKAVAALYERTRDYGAALGRSDDELEALIAARVFAGGMAGVAQPLAVWVRAVSDALRQQSNSELLAGRLSFPGWLLAAGDGGEK